VFTAVLSFDGNEYTVPVTLTAVIDNADGGWHAEGMYSDPRSNDSAICMTGDGLYAIEREVEKAIFA